MHKVGRAQFKQHSYIGGNHCDFCGAMFVSKLYACRSFEWEGSPLFRSDFGRLAACSDCATWIDVDKWEALATRVGRVTRRGSTRRELLNLYDGIRRHLLPAARAFTVYQVRYVRRTH